MRIRKYHGNTFDTVVNLKYGVTSQVYWLTVKMELYYDYDFSQRGKYENQLTANKHETRLIRSMAYALPTIQQKCLQIGILLCLKLRNITFVLQKIVKETKLDMPTVTLFKAHHSIVMCAYVFIYFIFK